MVRFEGLIACFGGMMRTERDEVFPLCGSHVVRVGVVDGHDLLMCCFKRSIEQVLKLIMYPEAYTRQPKRYTWK